MCSARGGCENMNSKPEMGENVKSNVKHDVKSNEKSKLKSKAKSESNGCRTEFITCETIRRGYY